jgi:hypothetical protein
MAGEVLMTVRGESGFHNTATRCGLESTVIMQIVYNQQITMEQNLHTFLVDKCAKDLRG